MKQGFNKRDAMLEAIRIRTRPVLMTAFAVSAGMLPVAQGAAIGLERLAPLGAVAIGGLDRRNVYDVGIYSCDVYLDCERGEYSGRGCIVVV